VLFCRQFMHEFDLSPQVISWKPEETDRNTVHRKILKQRRQGCAENLEIKKGLQKLQFSGLNCSSWYSRSILAILNRDFHLRLNLIDLPLSVL
jgi:hypothetical protein